MSDFRRDLPSVDTLLRDPAVAALLEAAPREAVVAAVREAVASARRSRQPPPADWGAAVGDRLRLRSLPSLRPVLNATGVILHTNLGRAPLADAAVAAVAAVASAYSTLEFDLPSGSRGRRSDHTRAALCRLSGAEDALVVNNAAAALVLALEALGRGGEVAVSRGELIEIGGSFRIPEILAHSGARLREIGTTNRTHLRDYADALAAGAAAVLIVHRSNFAQHGFVATPEPAAIAALAREAQVPCVYDVGSGLLMDLGRVGLRGEPRVQDAVASGADVVIFSGDKLLGGPQAGCLVGRADAVERCRVSPFARAVRADKLTLAGLEATLELYETGEASRKIPVLAMLLLDAETLRERAQALATMCPAALAPQVVPGDSAVGGGAFPDAVLPTSLVVLDPGEMGAEGLALRLRTGEPAVVARVASGQVLLDPRTLPADSFPAVGRALGNALDAPEGPPA
jgi:L-seryl-tRNA(Ser) seleniumtransferase